MGRLFLRKGLRQRPKDDRFDGKGPFYPGLQTSCKGPDPCDPVLLQQERRTGARRLVGSDTKKNDFAVTGDPVMLGLKFFGA